MLEMKQLSSAEWVTVGGLWDGTKPRLKKLTELSNDKSTVVRDVTIKVMIKDVNLATSTLASRLDAWIKAKDQLRFTADLNALSKSLSAVPLVSAAQVGTLSLDLNDLASWASGKGQALPADMQFVESIRLRLSTLLRSPDSNCCSSLR